MDSAGLTPDVIRAPRKLLALAALAALVCAGCKQMHRTDMTSLDQAGMWVDNIDELRKLNVSDSEVQQIVLVRQAKISDSGCVELIRIAHGRNELFANGAVIGDLMGAGLQESSILELARLHQLGLWAGEAEAMKLAGLPDRLILSVAKRRAAHQPVLSGAQIAALQNSGLTEKELLAYVDSGLTDSQAAQLIAHRNYLAGGHEFVHETGRRR